MGLFDLLMNFDPDDIVKKFDEFEQTLDKALENVSATAEKVENVAGIVEKKATEAGGAPSDTASKTIPITDDTTD